MLFIFGRFQAALVSAGGGLAFHTTSTPLPQWYVSALVVIPLLFRGLMQHLLTRKYFYFDFLISVNVFVSEWMTINGEYVTATF